MNYKSINHQIYLAEDKKQSGHKLLIKTHNKTTGTNQYYIGVIKDIITGLREEPIIFVYAEFGKDHYAMQFDLAVVEMLIVDIDEIL